jgi:uncharacterized protein
MKTNRTALITGASSGLGSIFARRMAQAGFDLVITGRKKRNLAHLAHELKALYGVSVQWVPADLSVEEDVEAIVRIINGYDHISILINNAGFGSGKDFCQCDLSAHLQMLRVHVTAALRLAHAVLPGMMSRREGTIINVSSLGALMLAPGSAMYSATKLFLRSFSESLHMEVRQYGIRVHCLCPGFVRTEFHQRRTEGSNPEGSNLIPWMEAEQVVDQCFRSIEKGRIVFVPGFINRLLVGIVKVIPRKLYYYLMEKLQRPAATAKPSKVPVLAHVLIRFGLRNGHEQFIKKPVSFF